MSVFMRKKRGKNSVKIQSELCKAELAKVWSRLCNRVELPALFSVIRISKNTRFESANFRKTLLDRRIRNFLTCKVLKFENSQV